MTAAALRRGLLAALLALLGGGAHAADPVGAIDALTRPVRALRGHERWVLSLAVSPDGRWLASGSDDQTLRLWNLSAAEAAAGGGEGEGGATSRVLRRFESAVTALAFTRDGDRLAVGTWDGELLLFHARTGEVIRELAEHTETITTIVFDPSGDYFASGSADDTLIVWDAKTGEDLFVLHQGNEYDVTTAAFSPDGGRIVTGDGENDLKLWDAWAGEEIETLSGHGEPVTCAAFLPDGRVVSGSWDDTLRIWGGEPNRTLRGHTDDITALAVVPGGTRLVSASEDKTLRVWDPRSGHLQATLRGHTDSVRSLALSPDGRTAYSGSKEVILVWPLGELPDPAPTTPPPLPIVP